MKKEMFIGSSKENFDIAQRIKENIEEKCSDWLSIKTWNDGDIFKNNNSTFDCLLDASIKFDYALFVASNDDITTSRGTTQYSARDNVIFEAGLFLGTLGKKRTFIVIDNKIKLLSDLAGITTIPYVRENIDYDGISENVIKELNSTKNSLPLKPMSYSALALGYFNNFIKPFCKKNTNKKLEIIIPLHFSEIKETINEYKRNNKSRERCLSFIGHARSLGYKYKKKKNLYWDIPTTLQVIKELIEITTSQSEICSSTEHDKFLEKELKNFGNAIEILVSRNDAYKEKISLKYISQSSDKNIKRNVLC